MNEEITIDHCPESLNGAHQPDGDNRCQFCDFHATHDEWWDYIKGA